MAHPILFTGHMIDRSDRKEPRFPAHKEDAVRQAIKDCLAKEKSDLHSSFGIAGGACGGDILFHEVCLELNILSEIYLTFEPEEFKQHSVSFAGFDWVSRFDRLINRLPYHILPAQKPDENVWAATNLWMLDTALQMNPKMTFIALWDGKTGDGAGGTEDMIAIVKDKGAKTNILYIQDIG